MHRKVANDRAKKWKALEVATLDNRLTHNLSYDSIVKSSKKHAMLKYDPYELPYLQPPKRSKKIELERIAESRYEDDSSVT